MKVAIYCRLSEEDDDKISKSDDSRSIQNQKSLLINYATEQGWEIYNIYSDDDYAGSDRSRPKFNELLKDAKAKKFDIILCKSQSRFTRELELVEKYIHGLFLEWGIRFVGLADNADTANKGNKKSRQINGLVNEWYLEDLSDNVRAVLTNKCHNGEHIGSFALYGYKKSPEIKNKLIIDDEAAAIVRRIYKLYQSGCGAQKIANILNEEKVPNPSAYKRLHGSNYKPSKTSTRGDLWSYTTITAMLRNQMYAGDMVQHKLKKVSYKSKVLKRTDKSEWIIVENTHEPIIAKDIWNKVQEQLDLKCRPYKSGNVHIFAGKIFCAECGKALATNHAKGVKYYFCPTHYTAKEMCPGLNVQIRKVEDIVLKEINALSDKLFNETEIDKQVIINNSNQKRKDKLIKSTANLKSKNKSLNLAIKNLYLDKLKGVITDAQFVEFNTDFLKEIETNNNLVEEYQKDLEAMADAERSYQNKIDFIKRYSHQSTLTREMVVMFIDRIEVHSRIKGTRDFEIDIHWAF